MSENKQINNASLWIRIVTIIVTVFLTVLTFIFCFAAVSVLIVRDITKQDNIEQIVENVDLANLRVGGILGSEDRNVTLTELIYDNTDTYFIVNLDISEARIEKLIEKSSLKSFIASKLNDYLLDVYTGTGGGRITKREIIALIDRNISVISNEFGTEFTFYSDSLSIYLDENINLDNLALKTLVDINFLSILRWGLSYYGITVMFLLCAILLVLIYMLNSADSAITLWLAAPFTAAGVVYLLLLQLLQLHLLLLLPLLLYYPFYCFLVYLFLTIMNSLLNLTYIILRFSPEFLFFNQKKIVPEVSGTIKLFA